MGHFLSSPRRASGDLIDINGSCSAAAAEEVRNRTASFGFAGTVKELRAQRLTSYPLGRVGTMADVVEAILFLLSHSSGWDQR